MEWVEPDSFPGGGTYRGPAAVAGYLRASRAMWRELVSTPTATRRGDDIVVVHHVHGVLADGTTHSMTVADVFTVVDGRVVRMRAYEDPGGAVRGARGCGAGWGVAWVWGCGLGRGAAWGVVTTDLAEGAARMRVTADRTEVS